MALIDDFSVVDMAELAEPPEVPLTGLPRCRDHHFFESAFLLARGVLLQKPPKPLACTGYRSSRRWSNLGGISGTGRFMRT
jgi:hypothetical protein